MSKIIISWRDVFDCKVPGQDIDDTARTAHLAVYKMFCHNDQIYMITDFDEQKTWYEPIGKIENCQ